MLEMDLSPHTHITSYIVFHQSSDLHISQTPIFLSEPARVRVRMCVCLPTQFGVVLQMFPVYSYQHHNSSFFHSQGNIIIFSQLLLSPNSNFTLQYMPLPLSDVTQAYRSAPEKTEQALTKVRSRLCLLQLSGSVLCVDQMLQYQLVSEGAVFDTVAISVKLYTTKKRSWAG